MPESFNKNNLFEEFAELVSIDSPSFGERKIADVVTNKLKALGFEVREDDAAATIGGSAGNIYAYLKGTDETRQSILFCAHLDTVSPALGKRAVLHDDGKITSRGDTVLGADDISGIIEILEGVRAAKASGKAYGDIEIVLPVAEEVYTKGTMAMDLSCIRSKIAYVLDMSGDVGKAAIQAPSMVSFSAVITGRASHAGFAPENGINALAAAAEAIARTKQGRVGKDTTFNIGQLTSGEASNIVPEKCVLKGEARSFDHQKAVDAVQYFENSLKHSAQMIGASVSFETNVVARAYSIDQNEPTVCRFLRAANRIGLRGSLVSTHGGSDNHNLIPAGINGIVLSCGMYSVHSVNENTTVSQLANGAALVRELILDEEI